MSNSSQPTRITSSIYLRILLTAFIILMNKFILLLLLALVVLAQADSELKLEDADVEVREHEPEPVVVEEPVKEAPKQQKVQIDILTFLSKLTPMQLIEKFKLEAAVLALIFVYILNYYIGKRTNKNMADSWLRSVGPTLMDNFAMVGFDPSHKNMCLLEESPHQFIFYASGRDNLQFMEVGLGFEPREDLIYHHVVGLLSPTKDLLTIDIPIDNSIPLVIYVIKKRDVKSVSAKAVDMSVTKQYNVANFPETHRIFGENAESVNHIIDNQIVNLIKQLPGVFNSFHYTDQKVYSNSPGHLRVLLNISKEGEKNELAIKLIMAIVDRIDTLKLSQNAKAKCQQSRNVLMATKARQDLQKKREQLQKQKIEKKKKEEQRIKALPADKQKKEYEKEKKRELKEFMKSRTVRM